MARKKAAGKAETRRAARRSTGKATNRRSGRAPARRRSRRRPLGQRLLAMARRLPVGLRGLSLMALAGVVLVLLLDGGDGRRPLPPVPPAGSSTAVLPVPPVRPLPAPPDEQRIAALQLDEREAPPLPPVRAARDTAAAAPAPVASAADGPVPAVPGTATTAGPEAPAIAALPPPQPAAPRLPAARPTGRALEPALPPREAALAVIIDDVGVAQGWAQRAVRLPAPVTLAFLPYARHLDELTGLARARGHEIFLHLAMEPEGSADPGPNALLASLDEQEMRRRIVWAIGRVPGAVGANNHMGSRLTADSAAMRIVMDELREAGLLFVDSMTTPRSVAGATAVAFGIPETMRDVFLDNEAEPEAIRRQLERAVGVARRKGSAVAIGHPYPATMEVLERWLPEAGRRGIRLVTASRMIELRRCDGGSGCVLDVHAQARP